MDRILLVTTDLLWIGKVRQLAARAGWDVVVPDQKSEVTHQLLDGDTKLVLVDLHHPRFEFVETIRLVRGTRWDAALVCYGSHVDHARMDQARSAGAQTVIPNGALEGELVRRLGLA